MKDFVNKLSIKPPILGAIIMLLLAMQSMPIGFYILLRLTVCLLSIFLAYHAYKTEKYTWFWGMILISLLFNPIIEVHLKKYLWMTIDAIVALIFSVYCFLKHPASKDNLSNSKIAMAIRIVLISMAIIYTISTLINAREVGYRRVSIRRSGSTRSGSLRLLK